MNWPAFWGAILITLVLACVIAWALDLPGSRGAVAFLTFIVLGGLAYTLAGCQTLSAIHPTVPRVQTYESAEYGHCAAVRVTWGGRLDTSAHACARVITNSDAGQAQK